MTAGRGATELCIRFLLCEQEQNGNAAMRSSAAARGRNGKRRVSCQRGTRSTPMTSGRERSGLTTRIPAVGGGACSCPAGISLGGQSPPELASARQIRLASPRTGAKLRGDPLCRHPGYTWPCPITAAAKGVAAAGSCGRARRDVTARSSAGRRPVPCTSSGRRRARHRAGRWGCVPATVSARRCRTSRPAGARSRRCRCRCAAARSRPQR